MRSSVDSPIGGPQLFLISYQVINDSRHNNITKRGFRVWCIHFYYNCT